MEVATRFMGAAGDAGHRSGGVAGARVSPVAAPKVAQSRWRGKYGVSAQAPRKVKRRSTGRKLFEAQEGSSNGRGHKGYVVVAWSRCETSRSGRWLSRRSKVRAVREALPRRGAGAIGETSVAEFVGGGDKVAAPWGGHDGRTENYKGGKVPRAAEPPGTHSRPCVSCLGRRA